MKITKTPPQFLMTGLEAEAGADTLTGLMGSVSSEIDVSTQRINRPEKYIDIKGNNTERGSNLAQEWRRRILESSVKHPEAASEASVRAPLSCMTSFYDLPRGC